MSKNTKKTPSINILAILIRVIIIIASIALIVLFVWLYFNVYKPEEKRFIKNSRIAYNKISNVIYEIYKEKQCVYEKPDEARDSVCEILAKKLSKNSLGNCMRNPTGMPQLNFVIKNTKIAIYGLERPSVSQDNNNIIKEFIIDVDGEEKGENEVGKDRVPVQIHSSGRMGGRLMPVNCNVKDMINYGMPMSKSCPMGTELNFLTTNVPFGFDVNQIGSAEGKIKKITSDVSFARADCAAFGGEVLGDEYCNDKGIYWLKRCYEEYYCGFEPSK